MILLGGFAAAADDEAREDEEMLALEECLDRPAEAAKGGATGGSDAPKPAAMACCAVPLHVLVTEIGERWLECCMR